MTQNSEEQCNKMMTDCGRRDAQAEEVAKCWSLPAVHPNKSNSLKVYISLHLLAWMQCATEAVSLNQAEKHSKIIVPLS